MQAGNLSMQASSLRPKKSGWRPPCTFMIARTKRTNGGQAIKVSVIADNLQWSMKLRVSGDATDLELH